MRTRSVIIIGFTILLVIFGISSILQWELSQKIEQVSEYHRFMSIPAISTLQEIQSTYQLLHHTIVRHIQDMDTHEITNDEMAVYDKQLQNLYDSIEKYNNLIFTKDSSGQFLAPTMMQEQMHNYVVIYKISADTNARIYEQIENGEISKDNAFRKLEILEEEFHQTLNQNTSMEIDGIEDEQNKIILVEQNMEFVFLISTAAAIITAIIVVILTSRFVSKPIKELVTMTQNISQGKFVQTKIKYNNDDVNEILDSLNEMSNDLKKYKAKIIRQEKLSSIGELASRLAHDIRNPLTVIKGTLDFIKQQNKNMSPEDIERFKRVDTAMYRITHQIDNVLDFIKGKPMELSEHQLLEIVDSVLMDIPNHNDIKIETNVLDTKILCDFEAMKIVLINLIINAIQALNKNGVIKIYSEIKDGKTIITVEDNGPEIAANVLEKMFEPLYTTKQEGTGLGLASCKSIIEQHKGTITVKSNPTRFIIELPIAKTD